MRYPFYITLFAICAVLYLAGANTLRADNTPAISDSLLQSLPSIPATITNNDRSALRIEFEIDRSQIPSLAFNELTLNVLVNDISSAQVLADSAPISHTYDSEAGMLSFTTHGQDIQILTQGASELTDFGQISKSSLLDNKGFAWSHGLDDNVGLKEQVSLLEGFGWKGTFFLIAESISDTRDEPWVVDRAYLEQKLALGWSFGNQTWDHECTPPFTQTMITRADDRLKEIVSTSDRSDYILTSFAAPCFAPEYHDVLLSLRDSGTTGLQYNESGNIGPLWIDTDASTEILDSETQIPNAYPFDFDIAVGRSTNLSANDAGADIDTIDWIAERHAETGEHFWFNTLTHGDDDPTDDFGDEAALRQFATHVYNTYGPNGNDQIWVAPSDQIYSYLLVREKSVIVDNQVFDASGGTVAIPTRTPPALPTPEADDVYLPFMAQ